MSNARKLADGIKSSADSTAITIDSSENVLIGKSTQNHTDVGHTLYPAGGISVVRSGGQCAVFNRTSSDGAVIDIRKDGTNKGYVDVTSDSVTYKTGQAQFNKGGYYSPAPFHEKNNHFGEGHRHNLGFFYPSGGLSYLHIKLNLNDNSNKMIKFEWNGFTYSGINAHNSVTFYTYSGTNSPYNPIKREWGNGHGIVNYYYSSDNKVVIVIQASGSYTGGFLYVQSGRSHIYYDPDVLATSSSNSTSGVF